MHPPHFNPRGFVGEVRPAHHRLDGRRGPPGHTLGCRQHKPGRDEGGATQVGAR